ncbi:MAG: DUF4214 domain-containing protein [Planctomycetaceae bacterium]|nr:DUF4214 domain-containing protein [Planctomycetaceae bacterium]
MRSLLGSGETMGWWRHLGFGSGSESGTSRRRGGISRFGNHAGLRRRNWGNVEPLEERTLMAIDWQSSDAVKSAILSARDLNQYTPQQLANTTKWVVGIHDMTQAGALGSQVSQHTVSTVSVLNNALIWEFPANVSAQNVAQQLGRLRGLDYFFPLVPLEAQRMAVPNDPYFANQWHLQNTGANSQGGLPGADANVVAAWDITKGAGVVIGIVDDSIQYTHPDLSAQYIPAFSFDFIGNDADPAPATPDDNHGTAVAGVAGARGNNGIGVTGAAQDASLAGIRLVGAALTDDVLAAALTFHNQDIDIYNNSWGYPGYTYVAPPLLLAAMEESATQGRGGLGSIVVFAAGNAGGADWGYVDVSAAGPQSSIYSITVAAIDEFGKKSVYSQEGSAVFVSAYSLGDLGRLGITTTDRTGNDGYNADGTNELPPDPFADVDYTSGFGGTSSATPLVSGVIALMLSANPSLSNRDVQEIIVQSARQNDPTDSGWSVNGAGHHINHKYGFGAIDALAAVTLAQSWTPVGAPLELTSGTIAVNKAVPDNNAEGITSSVTVAQQIKVERVEVVFDASIPKRGDLRVELISPDGTSSILAPANATNTGSNYSSWVFSSVRHWGEGSQGTWTIKVSDLDGNALTGTFNSWKLNIHGTNPTPPVAVDDVAAGLEEVPLAIAVLDNDTDADGRVVPSSIQIVTQPANGTLSINPQTGVITYTGVKDFFGVDSFTYTVADNTGGRSNAATVSITLANVNDAPVAVNDVGKTLAGPVVVDVLANDFDVDSPLLPASISILSGPLFGTASIDAVEGTITYTPPVGFVGGDILSYTITDSDGAVSAPATVRFRIGQPISLGGSVYVDNNGNGIRDAGEQGLPGVLLTLSKTDGLFTFTEGVTTGADGTFLFAEADDTDKIFPTGTYTINEFQPSIFLDGVDLPGNVAPGIALNDQFGGLVLAPGFNSTGWTFAERGLKAEFLASYLGAHLFMASNNGTTIESIILDSSSNPEAFAAAAALPGVSTFKLASDPPGLALNVNGQKINSAVMVVAVPGANSALAAPAIQLLNGKTYVFDSWSDGGASTRNVAAGSAPATLTARYRVLEGSTTNYSYVISVAKQLGIGTPAAEQLTQLTAQLSQGSSKSSVAAAVWGSAENLGKRVDALYQAFLKKAPDAATRASAVSRLQTGTSEIDLAAEILGGVGYAQAGRLTPTDFVNGLYQDVLGRNADAAGRNLWLAQLSAGKSRTEVAKAILNSDERLNTVVEQLYRDLLGRPADAGGKAMFVGLLRGGTSIGNAAAMMLGSQEFSQRIGTSQLSTTDLAFAKAVYTDLTGRAPTSAELSSWSIAVSLGSSRFDLVDQVSDSTEGLGRRVDQMYQTYLRRPADAAGRASNIAKLAAGTSEQDLAIFFLTSGEYTATHAANAAFIEGLYKDVLGRNADAAGRASWVAQLEQGKSRADVARSFLNSDERYFRTIDTYYASFLGRPADAAGRNSFVSGLKQGTLTLAAAAEMMLASDEYFARAGKRKL